MGLLARLVFRTGGSLLHFDTTIHYGVHVQRQLVVLSTFAVAVF